MESIPFKDKNETLTANEVPDATETHRPVRKKNKQKVNAILFGMIFIIVALVVAIIVVATVSKKKSDYFCDFKDSDYIQPRDFENPEPLDDLTPYEYTAINEFMMHNSELRITAYEHATINSNYIAVIELFIPNKADVVGYLDGKRGKPQRNAKVVVVRGNDNPPFIEEYLVGPLPKPTKAEKYKNPSYRKYPIPHTSRSKDNIEYQFIYPILLKEVSRQMYPLLMESYGLCYHNCTPDKNCIKFFDTAPKSYTSGERRSWIWGFRSVDGFYMNPLGIEMLLNHNSTNTSQWKIEKVIYNGQLFHSVESLMDAYLEKTLKLIHMDEPSTDRPYSSYEPKGELPEKPLSGPRLYEPDGKRFSVRGQQVVYDKWSFRYHMRASTGMQLFDVRFDGVRIAFEISLQDVLVFYTGYGATQSNTQYYDVSWFVGGDSMELARGIDCPETALFLDTYFQVNTGKPEKFKKNVCIFESNAGIPHRRHFQNDYASGYDFYGGLATYTLVIRTVANIWNYDYVFDYTFYANGAIEIKTSATGYAQTTFRLPQEEQYGGIINKYVVANLHAHLFNHKIDLDIDGTANRYSVFDIGVETLSNPWFANVSKTQMKIEKTLIQKESTQSTVKANVPQYHIIHNAQATNKFGVSKGYRILNKAPIPHILSTVPITNAAYWANYPIIVTKHNDSERESTSIYQQNNPYDPVLNFKTFINEENLVDKDLVAWVTTGTYHIPGTEDVPSTPTTWNQYSCFINPHNYFDEDPSIRSADNVVIRQTKNGDKPEIHTYGRSFDQKCVPKNIGLQEFNGVREKE